MSCSFVTDNDTVMKTHRSACCFKIHRPIDSVHHLQPIPHDPYTRGHRLLTDTCTAQTHHRPQRSVNAMLRQACTTCRWLLLTSPLEHAAGPVAMEYAMCSFVKAVTSGNPGLAFAAGHRTAATAAAAAAAGGAADGIALDDTAVQKLKELQAESPGTMLRIEVEGGGCSGFQYKFRLDSTQQPDDLVFERDGMRVVCDAVSLDFLKGAVVEYEDSLMRSAFQISTNPNAEASCGCGTSFAAKF